MVARSYSALVSAVQIVPGWGQHDHGVELAAFAQTTKPAINDCPYPVSLLRG